MANTFFFRWENKWIALWSILFISVNFMYAQENIRFERISVNEGLSQADVKSMVQDRFGFLWIGTRDGLSKYDGFEFTMFGRRKDDSTSLQFNQILDLQVDNSGDIWIGSIGGVSIYNYRQNSFENFFPSHTDRSNLEVNQILITGDTTALLATNKGLISFNRRQGKFFIDPALIFFQGKQVFCAYQNSDGLWVGTNNGVVMNDGSQEEITLLDGSSIYDIDFDVNGQVYLSSSKGLYRYDLPRNKLMQIGSSHPVTETIRTTDGDLWVAANKVFVFDRNDTLKYILSHDNANSLSLSEDRAKVIFQTRDGVIWIGTFGYGLNKHNPDVAAISYLGEQSRIPLSGNYVSTIYTTDDNILWVGTSRGLDVINLNKGQVKHFSKKEELFRILKIGRDRDNKIWVATSEGFMTYSDSTLILKNGSLRSVCDFVEWDDDNLVLASLNNGLYLFNRETGRTVTFISSTELPSEVSCLLSDDNRLWVGSKDGLRAYSRDAKLIRHFRADGKAPGSLPDSFIKSLYKDTSGRLWVGTWGGGLSLLNSNDTTFTTYDSNNGLPNNVVYGILEDSSHMLWLSTNLGVSVFDPSKQEFRNFDFFDGLQSNEFNTNAYFKSSRGKMYFGGVNGLSFFKPESILKEPSISPVLTTSITINNKPVSQNVLLTDKVQSTWKENNIGIQFTTIDFKYSRKYIFRYSLKDSVWQHIGSRRGLDLVDLSNGIHKVYMQSRLPGSNWSKPALLLTVDIIPPIWEQTWFRAVMVLILGMLVVAAYRLRIASLRQTNALLNRLVSERTREIQQQNEEIEAQNDQLHDLNKELQSFSYSVSHDLRAPLRHIIGHSKILEEDYLEKLDDSGKRTLNTIYRNAVRMNQLVNDLLEFSKLGKQELRKQIIDMQALVKGTLEEMNVSTIKKVEIKMGALPAIMADGNLLKQVWINLISNAIKYSAKKDTPIVEIGSYLKENSVVFYIKDNGAGFDMDYADKLFGVFQRLHHADEFEGTGVGLALVQRIVNKHHGNIWAEGKVDEGATFYFSLPTD